MSVVFISHGILTTKLRYLVHKYFVFKNLLWNYNKIKN